MLDKLPHYCPVCAYHEVIFGQASDMVHGPRCPALVLYS